MPSKRQKQLASAQDAFRARKRDSGEHRLQTWLSTAAASQLKHLCAMLSVGQAQVLEMALAKLCDAHSTRNGAKQ